MLDWAQDILESLPMEIPLAIVRGTNSLSASLPNHLIRLSYDGGLPIWQITMRTGFDRWSSAEIIVECPVTNAEDLSRLVQSLGVPNVPRSP